MIKYTTVVRALSNTELIYYLIGYRLDDVITGYVRYSDASQGHIDPYRAVVSSY